MKTLFLLFLSLVTLSMAPSHSGEDECMEEGCDQQRLHYEVFEQAQPKAAVEVLYVGSPVDLRNKLVVTADCDGSGEMKVVFEKKECGFTNFKVKGSKLSFTNQLYNPLDGLCNREEKEQTVDLKNLCR